MISSSQSPSSISPANLREMASLSNSSLISKSSAACFSLGTPLQSTHKFYSPNNLALSHKGSRRSSTHKQTLTIQASYSDGGRSGSGNAFIGGFVLGGIIIGTLGCVYAPQISKALTGADRKDIMKKLPKFIYDEEKALEKQRKKLAEKIDQLNAAIDNVSNQLRSEDEPPNGAALGSDDVEALI